MCLIEDQSWIDCIDITSRWDTFVLFHLYGNKGVSMPLWPIRPRLFHTFSPCAEPLGDGHEGMGARFGSQGSIALNWHSRYSGTRYSGTWLYFMFPKIRSAWLVWTKLLFVCVSGGQVFPGRSVQWYHQHCRARRGAGWRNVRAGKPGIFIIFLHTTCKWEPIVHVWKWLEVKQLTTHSSQCM